MKRDYVWLVLNLLLVLTLPVWGSVLAIGAALRVYGRCLAACLFMLRTRGLDDAHARACEHAERAS